MGRHAKPTALKLVQGNPGKRKLKKNVLSPCSLESVPEPPDWFGEIAKAMWTNVAPWLVEVKILGATELHNLEVFCMAYQRFREAQEEISKNGITLMGAQHPIKNPACTVSNETLRQLATYGGLLGLDPAARERLSPAENKKPGLESFLLD